MQLIGKYSLKKKKVNRLSIPIRRFDFFFFGGCCFCIFIYFPSVQATWWQCCRCTHPVFGGTTGLRAWPEGRRPTVFSSYFSTKKCLVRRGKSLDQTPTCFCTECESPLLLPSIGLSFTVCALGQGWCKGRGVGAAGSWSLLGSGEVHCPTIHFVVLLGPAP